MNEKHYKEKLSEFVNHELAKDEQKLIGEHILLCAECRAEHDEIKFGAALASELKQTNAPENLWNKIENSLDKKESNVASVPIFAFLNLRGLAAGLLISLSLSAAIYFGFLRNDNLPKIVENKNQTTKIETSQTVQTPIVENNSNQTTLQNSNQTNEEILKVKSNEKPNLPLEKQTAKIKPENSPKIAPNLEKKTVPKQIIFPSWNVKTLAGTPKIGDSLTREKLAVGEFLETDENSRARVEVANIGNVEIAPNSRVKLVGTKSTEHRLALEKGSLHARIFAPPRLFIVDTPSAVAVDLGCEYTLEVDESGNTKLHVTGGFVALENGERESIVPAGAIALTRKNQGVGTPFAENSTAEFKDALYKFDFENGGNQALEKILREAEFYDSLSLWHLLSRTPENQREKVFDALAKFVKPPDRVTKEGILQLDEKMLDAWWIEVENAWFS